MTELFKDKLKTCLFASWLLTVIFSFLGDAVFSVSVPAIGAIYPFRILLPVTALLFVIYVIRNKVNLWKEAGKLEKLCWLLAAVMLLYSAVSLTFAIDFVFSFRRLFNLCFDLCFFLLALRLCRDKRLLRYTLFCAGGMILVLCLAGIYEAFAGGIFNRRYEYFLRFEFFNTLLRPPVVTYNNTNDFVSAMVFALAVILLFWAQGYAAGKKRIWVLFALLPICFFMAMVASARLVLIVLWLLLATVILFFLLADRKRLLIPLAVLLLFFGVNFTNQYRHVMPVLKNHIQNVSMYFENLFRPDSNLPDNTKPTTPPPPTNAPTTPPIRDEFFEIDPDTGEVVLNQSASGGVRLRLLKHALDCFVDSKGMGVGLGNTEQLAKEKFADSQNKIWSIHCFPARIISDYGIWVLIPLGLIAFHLIRQAIKAIIAGFKKKSGQQCAVGLFYLGVLITYPILATVSSDAQDMLAMWLFLALICIFPEMHTPNDTKTIPAE